MCVHACVLSTPKVEGKELSSCFHKHPVKYLTLLLIEALDLQFSYADYFSDLKISSSYQCFLLQMHPRNGEWI